MNAPIYCTECFFAEAAKKQQPAQFILAGQGVCLDHARAMVGEPQPTDREKREALLRAHRQGAPEHDIRRRQDTLAHLRQCLIEDM